MTQSLLPPNAAALERALERGAATIGEVAIPVEQLLDPATCPAPILPWLAYGLSVDLWDPDWPIEEKRAVVINSIAFHRRKGTPASLRTVLDRFDPLIALVEWFEADPPLPPYRFRLELPLAADSEVEYSEDLIAAILRDIASVKPVRAHMDAVQKLVAEAQGWLVAGGQVAGFERLDLSADLDSATDPVWDTYLQDHNGEPLESGDGTILEFST